MTLTVNPLLAVIMTYSCMCKSSRSRSVGSEDGVEKQTDGQTDGSDWITFVANAVGKFIGIYCQKITTL